jgi:hypothetical protein
MLHLNEAAKERGLSVFVANDYFGHKRVSNLYHRAVELALAAQALGADAN